MKKILVALAVVLGMTLTGCASYSPDVDKTAIEQDNYLLLKSDKTLVECHEPGTSGYGGVGNDIFEYPAGQRTFSFTGESSESEMKPVPVVTSDGQTLTVPGFVKFTLTGECDALYDFHRKVGVKYNAYESGGWNNLLNDYLGVAVTSALNDAAGDTPWQTLYRDAAARKAIETELNDVLQDRVNAALGSEDWINIQGVSLSKPLASEALVQGLEAAEKAKLENDAQKQKNEVALTRYRTIGECLKTGLSETSCTIIFLSDNGANIPFIPVPQGGNINVSPR